MTLKRTTDNEIIEQIERQTGQTITRFGLYKIKQQIKKESYDWFKQMREGQYEYIHEFKERINEIVQLQKMHHEIINNDREPTTVKQASMNELHRLSVSNYFDVAPSIVNGITLSVAPENRLNNNSKTRTNSNNNKRTHNIVIILTSS